MKEKTPKRHERINTGDHLPVMAFGMMLIFGYFVTCGASKWFPSFVDHKCSGGVISLKLSCEMCMHLCHNTGNGCFLSVFIFSCQSPNLKSYIHNTIQSSVLYYSFILLYSGDFMVYQWCHQKNATDISQSEKHKGTTVVTKIYI